MELFVFLQDCNVMIWTNDGTDNTWSSKVLHKFNDVVWHVSWSVTGNMLAVSGGDNKVRNFNIEDLSYESKYTGPYFNLFSTTHYNVENPQQYLENLDVITK